MPNNANGSCTSLVVNELVTYVFDAYNNHPVDVVVQRVLDFYADIAIHDAKLALWNTRGFSTQID